MLQAEEKPDGSAQILRDETAFLEPKLMEKNLQRLREKGGVALFPESKVTAFLEASSKQNHLPSAKETPQFKSFLVVNCRASKAAQFYKAQQAIQHS